MYAKIIALVNEKGGAGKTTTAMNLAGSMANRRLRTLLVDADPQGTAMTWCIAAPENEPFPATVISLSSAGARLSSLVRDHSDKWDVIIIDGPPSKDSPLTRAAIAVADLVIVPSQLSPPDLWATARTAAVIREEQERSEDGGPPAYLLPTCVQSTNIAGDVTDAIAKLGLPVLTARLGYRTAYKEAVAMGTTVHRLNFKAAEEMDALTTEVISLLSLGNNTEQLL